MDTYPCIAMFACHTETVGQWCLLIFVYVHFLKANESLFYKENSGELLFEVLSDICFLQSKL